MTTEESIVARLFVGLPVPADIAAALARLAPSRQPGVRAIPVAQMHVTLHFLGNMAPLPVRQALRTVTASALSLRLGRPGSFSPRGRRRILWIGITESSALDTLHARVAEASRTLGFEPEKRPYHPHITLSRLDARAPRRVVTEFERRSLAPMGQSFSCDEFALFESETAPEGARYEKLESFPLSCAGD